MRPSRAALVAVVLLAGTRASVPGRAGAATNVGERPNIVLIMTDDMTTEDLAWMPITQRLLGDEGVSFDANFVNDPSCCPSRVTMLTGKYAHNTGIYTNGGTNGGFETAHQRGLESDTIATRLQRAGYRTGLFGKYLNGYPNGVPIGWVPPGWTRWVSPVSGDPYGQYGYRLNVDGSIVEHAQDPDDYGTTVYARAARTFVRTSARRDKPFFAALTVYAPHLPATPAPQDVKRFHDVRAPRTPSFNQRDVSANPNYIRELQRFGPKTIAAIDDIYRERIRSLQAVDRQVGRLMHAVSAAGDLDRTYFVFTSDNGFHLGQHRLPAGKFSAYDTDIRVPLLVRGPGIASGGHVQAITGNVDLMPTFEAMARVHQRTSNDGMSLLDLARDPGDARWTRNAYLVEHRKQVGTVKPARDATLPLEPADPETAAPDADVEGPVPAAGAATPPNADQTVHRAMDAHALRRTHGIPDFDAVRTTRWLYVEYVDGEKELYDVRHDPDEVVNLAGKGHVSVEATLHRRLDELRTCAGASCRRSSPRSVVGAG